jgi:hypothetical protein
MPAFVAVKWTTASWFEVGYGALVLALIWVFALTLTLDASAYVYGFKRPFLSALPGRWLDVHAPTVHTKLGAVLTVLGSYAMILYGFAVVYAGLSAKNPNAFHPGTLGFLDSVYFTAVTAATVGYGDIYPKSPAARALVLVQIIMNLLFVVFLLATVATAAMPQLLRRDHED